MIKTIWKFQLDGSPTKVRMPIAAKILCVQAQGDTACLWAEVWNENATELRTFNVYGTGHTLPDAPGEYVGTFQLHDGALVFHVYEDSPR